MAVEFDIERVRRDDNASVSSTNRRDGISANWNINVTLRAKDLADPGFTGEDVTAIEAVSAIVLPRVGRDVYEANGYVIPWLVCTNKQAKRVEGHRKLWEVQLSYSGQGDAAVALPTSIDDVPPKIEYDVGEFPLIRWLDQDNKICRTPTGNAFADPFVQRIGTREKIVTQLEHTLTHVDMAARRFSVNGAVYSGDAAETWTIADINAKDVTVPLVGGPYDCVLVVYMLAHNPSTWGWRDARGLIDSHYLESANDLTTRTPYYDEKLRTYTEALIALDGTLLPNQQGSPVYDSWGIQHRLDFNTFLKA